MFPLTCEIEVIEETWHSYEARRNAAWLRPYCRHAEHNDGDFGEVCGAQGGAFDSNGMCTVAAGQIWDPYSGVYQAFVPDGSGGSGAYRSDFIPYNKVGAYASPGNPKLAGTPYALLGAPGDLVDPIAQAMMKMFPEPSQNMPNSTIYDNWVGSGTSRPDAHSLQHQHVGGEGVFADQATGMDELRASPRSRECAQSPSLRHAKYLCGRTEFRRHQLHIQRSPSGSTRWQGDLLILSATTG